MTADYTNLELRVLEIETTLAGIETGFELPIEMQIFQQALLENKIEFDADGNLKVKTIKMEGLEETTRPVCDSSKEGTIYYDKTDKHFYGCNGSVWEILNNPVIEEELP